MYLLDTAALGKGPPPFVAPGTYFVEENFP